MTPRVTGFETPGEILGRLAAEHNARNRPAEARRLDRAFLMRGLWLALSIGGMIVLVSAFSVPGPGYDFYAYWAVDPAHPYSTFYGFGGFRYAPPLIWLAGPLKLLPFEVAYPIWTALLFGVLVLLTRKWALAWLLFPPVVSELYHGNVHLLLAGALVWGFRYPALWAFLPLSKLTTALPLGWLILRRDARIIVPVIVGLGLCAVSLVLTPGAWPDFLGAMRSPTDAALDNGGGAQIMVLPLLPRLVIAGLITIWAARTGRRWPLAVALILSLPQVWIHGLAILVAIPGLRTTSRSRTLG